MRELLFIALILACPLLMMLMMRHGHGHGHGDHRHAGRNDERASTDELRRRREELDRVIEEREERDETLTGVSR